MYFVYFTQITVPESKIGQRSYIFWVELFSLLRHVRPSTDQYWNIWIATRSHGIIFSRRSRIHWSYIRCYIRCAYDNCWCKGQMLLIWIYITWIIYIFISHGVLHTVWIYFGNMEYYNFHSWLLTIDRDLWEMLQLQFCMCTYYYLYGQA